ncbi:hypothetical protein K488DRAFT_61828 [Vararia minispora EC-137]|uniref:Uncharacterized protein n=1 Tax=Vararia minispora EC-137 TaxID=1314806 RepID=A0ACB8Q731_9AGAM|nr:hypothetical protein K488DRAFT_61828 [Vararia minispora EC-137]
MPCLHRPTSPSHRLLVPLALLDLHVGDDDLTANKDYKHVAFKHMRNTLLCKKGMLILGVYLTPSVLWLHLRDENHSLRHINSVLDVADKQNVELAYRLLRDLWSLPQASLARGDPYVQARDALHLFGDLCHHLIFPYICVDLSLSEQLEHLSCAAHIALALFHYGNAKAAFLPIPLFVDIMVMIKNMFFCVAKVKIDRPDSNFYVILLGTDRLESLFGILHTMVGNDANLDVQQLALRISGATDIANIFARYPEWAQGPRRLRIPALTRERQAVEGVNHISPRHWHGDVRVCSVTLATAWKSG